MRAISYWHQTSGACAGMCACNRTHQMEKTGSGEQKLHGLVATRGPTMVEAKGKIFDFGRSRSLENTYLSVRFSFIHPGKYGWY